MDLKCCWETSALRSTFIMSPECSTEGFTPRPRVAEPAHWQRGRQPGGPLESCESNPVGKGISQHLCLDHHFVHFPSTWCAPSIPPPKLDTGCLQNNLSSAQPGREDAPPPLRPSTPPSLHPSAPPPWPWCFLESSHTLA